jgi:hypothetical protein
MNAKKLRSLLDKYYKGDTILSEEEALRRYFVSNPDIPEEFRTEMAQFLMIDKAKNQDIPFDDFEEKLEKLIDNQKIRYPVFRRTKFWIQVTGIAASILIVFSIYNSLTDSDEIGTIEDPNVAYEETQKALYYISEKFNSGTKELTNISKIDDVSKMLKPVSKIDQGFSKLKVLSRIPVSEDVNK